MMKKFRLQARFLIPLLLCIVAAAYLMLPLLDQLTLRWYSHDLNARGELVTKELTNPITTFSKHPKNTRLQARFNDAVHTQRLVAIGLCSPDGRLLERSTDFPHSLSCQAAKHTAQAKNPHILIKGGPVYVSIHAIAGDAGRIADLIVLHDFNFIEQRSQDTRRYLIVLITVLGGIIAIVTLIVAHLSWRAWIAETRAVLNSEGLLAPTFSPDPAPELAPLAADLRARLRDFDDEYRRIHELQPGWKPDRLRSLLRTHFLGDQIIVVANREPYVHEEEPDGTIRVKRPAGGLVTAIEPVMRACSGTWIAHGSGSADRRVVDAKDRVRVPPGRDEYTLRRVWLSEEEELGHYGFSNEGLWPLCHVAHVRPVFRETAWRLYRDINRRFAEAVVAEASADNPVVLVQDYHFALLPAMIRERLPNATILCFWHIPWPNPESFGICPWRNEILEGMLGSDILGFHTRFHCKNFVETVDRYLEARIEHELSTISFNGKETLIKNYPISIEWPTEETVAAWPSVEECRRKVFERFGLTGDHRLVVGVDRFDYTKGILERLHALEYLLENSDWVGRLTLAQVAAPSRTSLEEYQAVQERVQHVAAHINQRFGSAEYTPVRLIVEHYEQDAITELYRAADVCIVSCLHDGMNLVCKEFVSVRDDERGVLILSRFTGASYEMREALIVNPYHVEEMADALRRAITMPEAEQRERMISLRATVREFNVYRWAERMLTDAERLRSRERIKARVERHQAE